MPYLDWFGDGSLYVVDIALACCAVEFSVAALRYDGTDPRQVDELPPGANVAAVVSGTVTDVAIPMVRSMLQATPDARVISFGACASAGGPYWDSYAVTKGISQFCDVDVFVPGCPPTPEALTQVLEGLRGAVSSTAVAR